MLDENGTQQRARTNTHNVGVRSLEEDGIDEQKLTAQHTQHVLYVNPNF